MSGCRALSDSEVQAVLAQLEHPRDRALFILGLRTGFRISELLSLTINDVFDGTQIRDRVRILKANLKGKSQSREVVLHPQAREALAVIVRRRYHLPGEALFQSRTGYGAISRVQAHRILKAAYAKANVTGRVATHTMRKTFAHKVYNALKHDLVATKDALGHSSILNTIKYLAPNQSAIDSAVLSD